MEQVPASIRPLDFPPPSATAIEATPGANRWGQAAFVTVLLVGGLYIALQLFGDLSGVTIPTSFPFTLLALSLVIALGFEFVNGFHDTANAVATVIYTHALPPNVAVVWSGIFNLLGVLASSGAVAFGIVALLPVELILKVGSDAGFAMVFALLLAAIIWNVGTWYLGLPSSSSHTLIGSVIGVGLMNQLITGGDSTSGVDWNQGLKVMKSLVLSPMVGFSLAALLLLAARQLIPVPKLYTAPEGKQPPPWWIRGLLILTCTSVSFAHGSNDGQKGMGLIMLILIGCVPTAYALNRAVSEQEVQQFQQVSQSAVTVLGQHGASTGVPSGQAREAVTEFLRTQRSSPATLGAVQTVMSDIAQNVSGYQSLAKLPAEHVSNVRNDMYLVGEAFRLMKRQNAPAFSAEEETRLSAYAAAIDKATKFIPPWVKVAVALALGMGTMIGWKRIVVTVGERIGKQHLTYAQGASAELVAAGAIGAADVFGLPVSTTHTLSSGVAGSMAANRSGLQWATVRNILLAWALTFPASIALSGGLFWLFRHAL